MYALVLAASVAAVAITALYVSRLTRGRRRLLLQRFGVYSTIPAVTALLVLLPLQLKLSFGDGLSLAGLLLSLAFGFGTIDRIVARLRVGVVIPSRVPFNSELRQGLKETISVVRLDMYDDYLATNQAAERLSEFMPALRRTLAWRPDYLAVYSPSVQLVSSDQVISLLEEFVRQGGGVVFIDNEPIAEVRERLGKQYGLVTSDVATGARIITEYVQQQMADDDDVLVLSGPQSSAPAQRRREMLANALPKATIRVADTGGWTAESAYSATMECFRSGMNPRFIICGNDVMAFGAIRAIREIARTTESKTLVRSEVIGYDGIARALFSIADDQSPFVATISTPPAAYGQETGAMILADARRIPFAKSALRNSCIPVGDGQLVTRFNVELVLDG